MVTRGSPHGGRTYIIYISTKDGYEEPKSAERFHLGRIMPVDVLHNHTAILALGRQKGRNVTHRHAPVDFYTGADTALAKHHVYAHRTTILEMREVCLPPMADIHQ